MQPLNGHISMTDPKFRTFEDGYSESYEPTEQLFANLIFELKDNGYSFLRPNDLINDLRALRNYNTAVHAELAEAKADIERLKRLSKSNTNRDRRVAVDLTKSESAHYHQIPTKTPPRKKTKLYKKKVVIDLSQYSVSKTNKMPETPHGKPMSLKKPPQTPQKTRRTSRRPPQLQGKSQQLKNLS